ncbi:PREDICTED: protein BEAN1-like [Ficedula albicollis]|uniref:Brain expressed associated with NEDD4 1 n=1 Tax=Ficedula albicollis TaxID=59894 RepID=U3JYV9_FICAL|nr:PREDICTED: protein BEAN1-like [Ficedula albicollis]
MGKGSGWEKAGVRWDGEGQGLERAGDRQRLRWGRAEAAERQSLNRAGIKRAEPSRGKARAERNRVIFFHLPLISGSSISIGIGSNYSNLPVASNQSSAASAFPGPGEHGGDSSLLVSPLLVAGVVIGLVLFLSCATIVVGSLRKDSRPGRPRLPRDAPDGFSHGGSSAELRSTCTEEFPPACDFDSYLDILSQGSIMYPDPPPCYDECVGPGATQIYIPTDDPPPYSLTDPCQRNEIPLNLCIRQEEEAAGTAGGAAHCAGRLQDWQQPSSGISVISQCGGGSPVRDSGV